MSSTLDATTARKAVRQNQKERQNLYLPMYNIDRNIREIKESNAALMENQLAVVKGNTKVAQAIAKAIEAEKEQKKANRRFANKATLVSIILAAGVVGITLMLRLENVISDSAGDAVNTIGFFLFISAAFFFQGFAAAQ